MMHVFLARRPSLKKTSQLTAQMINPHPSSPAGVDSGTHTHTHTPEMDKTRQKSLSLLHYVDVEATLVKNWASARVRNPTAK